MFYNPLVIQKEGLAIPGVAIDMFIHDKYSEKSGLEFESQIKHNYKIEKTATTIINLFTSQNTIFNLHNWPQTGIDTPVVIIRQESKKEDKKIITMAKDPFPKTISIKPVDSNSVEGKPFPKISCVNFCLQTNLISLDENHQPIINKSQIKYYLDLNTHKIDQSNPQVLIGENMS